MIDVAPLHMFLWEADGSGSYGNLTSADYFGTIPPKAPMEFLDLVTHPEDVGQLKEGIRTAMASRRVLLDGSAHASTRWRIPMVCIRDSALAE